MVGWFDLPLEMLLGNGAEKAALLVGCGFQPEIRTGAPTTAGLFWSMERQVDWPCALPESVNGRLPTVRHDCRPTKQMHTSA